MATRNVQIKCVVFIILPVDSAELVQKIIPPSHYTFQAAFDNRELCPQFSLYLLSILLGLAPVSFLQ